MHFSLHWLQRGLLRAPRLRTTIATGGSIFIFAFTATTWDWTSITIRLPILMRATVLLTSCFTTRATPRFMTAPKQQDSMWTTIGTVSRARGVTLTATERRTCMWPMTLAAAIFIAIAAMEHSQRFL